MAADSISVEVGGGVAGAGETHLNIDINLAAYSVSRLNKNARTPARRGEHRLSGLHWRASTRQRAGYAAS